MSLRNTECGNFPEISVRKVNSRKFPFLRPVKCSRSWTGTLFPHRRMYKNRVSEGINVPVSTWEFPLFWKVIFQREASFGSLFVTVQVQTFFYIELNEPFFTFPPRDKQLFSVQFFSNFLVHSRLSHPISDQKSLTVAAYQNR